jgi:hypothetical protein
VNPLAHRRPLAAHLDVPAPNRPRASLGFAVAGPRQPAIRRAE